MKSKINFKHDHRGGILLFAMIFGAISFSLIVVGVAGYAVFENHASGYKHNREMAFQIAEAGANYYRWHLAHAKDDYYDGQGAQSSGPYVHEYKDKTGKVVGYFSLNISPPLTGSTVLNIESTGWTVAQPNSKRTLRVRIGFPSLVDYAFLTNTDVWIGNDEAVHGKFHANGGIRFDGTTDAPITSAAPTYICKVFHGCGNQQKPGIWGDGGPADYWKFPVPAKDFDAITSKLAQIKTGAQESGLYLTSSGKEGWRLQFMNDGTVKTYKVNTTNCYKGKDIGDNKYYWFCIDAKTYSNPATYAIPANGYIYVEDNVWVDGVVKGRVTVGTAAGKSIIINSNITYAAKDGANVLGLIGEQNILVPYNSPNNLEIDAAVVAQKGAAKRYYYPGNTKDSILIYGAVISANIWTWSWTSGGSQVVSGYENTISTYDANLTYSPPPGFPVGAEYNLISWEEI